MTAGDRLNRIPTCPRCQADLMRYVSNPPERDRTRSAAKKSECRAALPERSRSWSSETHQPVDICRRALADRAGRPSGIPRSIPRGVASHRAPPLPSRPLTRAHQSGDACRQRPPRLRSYRRSSVIARRTIRAPRSGQGPTPFQELSLSPCTEPDGNGCQDHPAAPTDQPAR